MCGKWGKDMGGVSEWMPGFNAPNLIDMTKYIYTDLYIAAKESFQIFADLSSSFAAHFSESRSEMTRERGYWRFQK
jgi:hypothetical protein